MPVRPDPARRRFLRGRLIRPAAPPPWQPRPPWSAAGLAACSGCGDCVDACPQAIIALDDGGLPALDFAAGECTFCGACADACPEPVFLPAGARHAPGFDHLAEIGPDCFAAHGIHCQSCGDACPEHAIRFAPRIGAPPLPRLDAEACTGCGACIAPCPAAAIACRTRAPGESRDV